MSCLSPTYLRLAGSDSTDSGGGSETLTIDTPATAGNLLLLTYTHGGTNGASTPATYTTPAGWTLIDSAYNTVLLSGVQWFASTIVYARIADGTEDAITLSCTSSHTGQGRLTVHEFTGISPSIVTASEVIGPVNAYDGRPGNPTSTETLSGVDAESLVWWAITMAADDGDFTTIQLSGLLGFSGVEGVSFNTPTFKTLRLRREGASGSVALPVATNPVASAPDAYPYAAVAVAIRSTNPPVPVLSASPTSGESPLIVNFSSADSTGGTDGIASRAWDFGDGNSSTDANPTHTYTAPGLYTAELTLTGNGGCVVTETVNIEVGLEPRAELYVSPSSGTTATTFNFFSGSYAYFGLATVAWSFGDGTTDSGVNVSHTYASPGIYTVTLTVADGDGRTDSATSNIVVSAVGGGGGAGPTAVVSKSPSSGTTATAFTFSSSGSTAGDSAIVSYSWDSSDGFTGNGTSAIHTFTTPGTHTVTLTITDANGLTDTDTVQVVVSAVGGGGGGGGGGASGGGRRGWQFINPNDSNDRFVWEVNPNQDDGSAAIRKTMAYAVEAAYHKNGAGVDAVGTLAYLKNIEQEVFAYSGNVYTQNQYNDLISWCERDTELILVDDLGRAKLIYITNFEVSRVRARRHPFKHSYRITGIVLQNLPNEFTVPG